MSATIYIRVYRVQGLGFRVQGLEAQPKAWSSELYLVFHVCVRDCGRSSLAQVLGRARESEPADRQLDFLNGLLGLRVEGLGFRVYPTSWHH